MQLMFNRCKIFMSGSQRYVGSIGPDGRAPDWIRETDTFKMGVQDGSIIDFKAVAAAQETEVQVQAEEPAPMPQMPGGIVTATVQRGRSR